MVNQPGTGQGGAQPGGFGTTDPGTTGPAAAGPGTAGPGTAGPGTAGPGTAGPGTAVASDAAASTGSYGGAVAERSAAPGVHEAFHGRPVSWVAVTIILVGCLVGGFALVFGPIWWLFWTGAGLLVIGALLGTAVNMFDDWY